jgi:hypothetical protein
MPAASHRGLGGKKWSSGVWFALGGACVIAVVVAVGWYQRGAEARDLIESCQQSVLETRSRYESVEGIEFHGMTAIDYSDAKVVMGVMTGGPPPDSQTVEATDGVFAQTLVCNVTDDGEASYVFGSAIK